MPLDPKIQTSQTNVFSTRHVYIQNRIIIKAAMESEEKEEVCIYCGIITPYTEKVKQIPREICSQEFLLNDLHSVHGDQLNGDDIVCTDHEEVFRLKYLSKQRGHSFSKSYVRFNMKEECQSNQCPHCGKDCSNAKKHVVSKSHIHFQVCDLYKIINDLNKLYDVILEST